MFTVLRNQAFNLLGNFQEVQGSYFSSLTNNLVLTETRRPAILHDHANAIF